MNLQKEKTLLHLPNNVSKRPPAEKWLYSGFPWSDYEAVCESESETIKGKWRIMSKVRFIAEGNITRLEKTYFILS